MPVRYGKLLLELVFGNLFMHLSVLYVIPWSYMLLLIWILDFSMCYFKMKLECYSREGSRSLYMFAIVKEG